MRVTRHVHTLVLADGEEGVERRQEGRRVRDLRDHGKKAKSEGYAIMNICGGRKR